MDSNPTQTPSLPVKASATKLPIKRKTPDNLNPNPNPNFLTPKLESTTLGDFSDDTATPIATAVDVADSDTKSPPFKFHRIWTEPDEIRFLQGLLDSAPEGLVFPKDLHVFYGRFSTTMSKPYTKSQLSEKLRRLRKKFRVISSRLARGLDASMLSPHDRSLFELSKKLWSSEYSSTSPFLNNLSHGGNGSSNSNKNKKIVGNLVPVKLSFSPSLPLSTIANPTQNKTENAVDGIDCDVDVAGDYQDNCGDDDVKLSEVVEVDCGYGRLKEDLYDRRKLCRVAAETALDVFDLSLKEVRRALFRQGRLSNEHRSSLGVSDSSKNGNVAGFEKRWQEQWAVEVDVFARRLRIGNQECCTLLKEAPLCVSLSVSLHLLVFLPSTYTTY
ncbi:putative DNA-binding storekeeper protein-related transcriptional regulator [Quillaja saponaria]|uniref:DNA-binding storekeeper protein-related transcriptional regulator n=1 Tax=Quillaja saponaria TaxID=32244 RepID=A0AAD7LL02_QUISA|nr:putative DNA-binding storekeeper protein-related transcriptional regulator [Quillaja saponaria]